MTEPAIRFKNGAAYQRYMGQWSQLVGAQFLQWIDLAAGLEWLDVGCGNGAFTALVLENCAPQTVHGIDPSAAQLAYAQAQPELSAAAFFEGNAMALPFADARYDAAIMPLVIFFVPDPLLGVQEMKRVVRPGGTVAAYAWDMEGAGFPYHALHTVMQAMGIEFGKTPSPQASRLDVMQTLWQQAGLVDIHTRQIEVTRSFANFDDFWATAQNAPSVGPVLAQLPPEQLLDIQSQLRTQLPAQSEGSLICTARANAIEARVPQQP